MKWDPGKGCFRATKGDAAYGPSCPDCASPKDNQALLCQACRTEEKRRLARYWERRTCECGNPKDPYRAKCMTCEYARRRTELPARDRDGWFVHA